MSQSNDPARQPPPMARLKSALALDEKTVAGFAREIGVHPPQVWMALKGDRLYPEIVVAAAAAMGEDPAALAAEIRDRRAALTLVGAPSTRTTEGSS